jgi:hypothetical protein
MGNKSFGSAALVAAAGVCVVLVSSRAFAQDADAGAPVVQTEGAHDAVPQVHVVEAPTTITMSKDDLEKLIDARIKVAAEATAAAAANPTVGDGQKDVKAAFSFANFAWSPSNLGSSDRPLSWGPFTGEIRVDTVFHQDFSNPKDHTISGSSEVFRSGEFQVTQLGFGGDFIYKNVQARLMTQFGMYSQTTPRNDASPAQGQWNLADAYRYISEAYLGYHIPVLNGINIQAGIFMSYIGLWSYYNFDNWTYQPSYVSSNTPWFFNGVRVQIFPSEKLKIEPWLVNGWQSYGVFNQAPGVGMQISWKPVESFALVSNNYFGTDTLGVPDRKRIHTDDSIMVRLYRNKDAPVSQVAASLTVDAGCEFGDGNAAAGVNMTNCGNQYFLGFMAYARAWVDHDHFAATIGGGAITNPGRYLVLVPPINGATAFSGVSANLPNDPTKYGAFAGLPAFPACPQGSPGCPSTSSDFNAWDMQITGDYMPNDFITFRVEYNHRAASIPYFAGSGGMTPCVNGTCSNQGAAGSWPGQGTTPTVAGLNNPGGPDLSFTEDRITVAMMMKF